MAASRASADRPSQDPDTGQRAGDAPARAATGTQAASDAAAEADEELVSEELDREGGSEPGPFGVGHAMTRAPRLQSPLRVAGNGGRGEAGDAEDGSAPAPQARLRALAGKAWRVFLQLSLIVCICLAGERIADVLPVDVPSNICSMVVLLVFLVSGVLKMECISEGADFLLDHMSIFFIPAAVAIMGSFDLIAGNVIKLVLICLITTVLVFFVTSFTVSTVMNLMVRREQRAAGADAGAVVEQVRAGVEALSRPAGAHDGKDVR